MACGCVDRCSCYLEGEGGIIVTGSGDIGSPWKVSPPPETVFAASTIDGSIAIVPAGPAGHNPALGVKLDPAGTAPVSVGVDGIRIDCCSVSGDVPIFAVVNTSVDVILDDINTVALVDSSANNVTVSLPQNHTPGRIIKVKDATGSVGGAFTLTVDSDDGDLVDTIATYVFVTPFEAIEVVSDGSDWFIV